MARRKPRSAEDIAKWGEKRVADDATLLSDKLSQMLDMVPADAGTPNERKIMAIKLFPERGDYNISQLCAASGVSRKAWYRAHSKEGFGAQCVTLAKRIKGPKAPEVMVSFIENALSGNVTAQLEYLRDVGAMSKAEKGDSTINVNIAVVEQKRNQSIKTGLERFGYTVDTD